MVEVAAVVLAAGRASRFNAGEADEQGTSKVLALLEGRTLLSHVVATATASRAAPVIVVTGRDAARAAALLQGSDVVIAHNPRFAEGIAGSIAVGLDSLPAEAEAAIILLADMPRVVLATLDALIAAFERDRPDAVVPCHAGRRGNPVLIARALFPALLRLVGDEGARRILAEGDLEVMLCEVDDPGVLVDVDTRQALDELASRSERQAASRPAVSSTSTSASLAPPSQAASESR